MRFSSTLLVISVVAASACGGQSPTAPSAAVEAALVPGAASPAETSSPLELRSLTGLATNALTGAGVGGVTIRDRRGR